MVQCGEFHSWSLVGVNVCLITNSPNSVHTFCSWQVGRIKVWYLGLRGLILLIYILIALVPWVTLVTTIHTAVLSLRHSAWPRTHFGYNCWCYCARSISDWHITWCVCFCAIDWPARARNTVCSCGKRKRFSGFWFHTLFITLNGHFECLTLKANSTES